MATKQIIQSRLGEREVDTDKILTFPRGLIGLEHLRQFALLSIREDAPLLVLQSLEDPILGLLVADPFCFIANYTVKLLDADQKFLQVDSPSELAVLVTASIPPGKPEETMLNLMGPIFINFQTKIAIQVPQMDEQMPDKVFVHNQMHSVKKQTRS